MAPLMLKTSTQSLSSTPATLGVVLAQPHHRAAAVQRQHHQVVAVGAVDAPLLVRRDEVEQDLLVAVRLDVVDAGRGLQVHRRAVAAEALAEGDHPRVVQVELLAAGQRAPGDQLVHVGVAGVVADGLALDAAPGRAADDLARLRLHVAVADLLVLAVQRQVRVVAAGLLAQGLPGLHRHVAVGLGRQLQDDLAGVDVGHDLRHALGHAFGQRLAVELAELLDLGAGLPADALAAVAQLVHQGAERGEALEHVRVVALDHRDLRRGLAGDQLALALLPFLHVEGLGQFAGGVVHDGRQHHLLLDAQVADADLAEGLGEALVDLPVAAALPHRVHRRAQRVDEGVHVAGVEVVLLVPAGGGQHDVAVQAGGAHAEVQRHHQVELADRALLVPLHLARLGVVLAEVLALDAVLGAQQVLAEVLVALARRAQQVAAPDEQHARPVLRRVRVLAAHLHACRPSAPRTT